MRVKIKKQMKSRPLTGAVLASLYTSLQASPLVSSLRYTRDLHSPAELSILVTPRPKWGKHFSLEVLTSLSSDPDSLQTQLDSLTSVQPYLGTCSGTPVIAEFQFP